MDKLNSLFAAGDVILVGNDKLEGNPLVTPLLDAQNNPKTDLNGNELGSIRLEQEKVVFNGGFLNSAKRVAFISGTLDNLWAIIKTKGLKNGSSVPGNIVQIETLTPVFKNHRPKMNPSTQEIVAITVGDTDYPVYMQQMYTEDLTKKDVLVRTVDDVTNIINAQRALSVTANVAEDLSVPQE
jgi:hypothetical protein